jgi:hypothetical protein
MHFCALSGFAGFDVADLSEDAPDDVVGLDASAAHVANLLSTEPADSMLPKFFFSSIFLFVDWLSLVAYSFISSHLIKQILQMRLLTFPLLLYHGHAS